VEHLLRRLARPPWVVPAFVLLFTQWEVWLGGLSNPVGPLLAPAVSGGVAALLLLARRLRPLLVQIAVAVVMVTPWLIWGAPESGAGFAVGMIATYAVGRWKRGPASYVAVVVVAAWILAQVALDPLQPSVADGWGWTLWGVAAWGAGRWMRQHAELDTRRAAEHEAQRRAQLAEQRLAIARDLHDVLASSLGVIVVHAEAAEELLPTDPDRAAQAMRRVQDAGRDGLTQARSVLGALRGGRGLLEQGRDGASDHDLGTGLRGQPGLEDVGALIEQLRTAGLPVAFERHGDRDVPAEVGTVVYRLLQEALTNVVRHAGLVATTAFLSVDDTDVTVEVTNAGALALDDVTLGNGLRGMRERLEPFGATLDVARRPEGGLRVHSVIPAPRSREHRVRLPTRRRSSASTPAP
jgi:signal transduction histidine kinase